MGPLAETSVKNAIYYWRAIFTAGVCFIKNVAEDLFKLHYFQYLTIYFYEIELGINKKDYTELTGFLENSPNASKYSIDETGSLR